jgi:hypothetical protein
VTAVTVLVSVTAAVARRAPWFARLPGTGTIAELFDIRAEANVPAWLSSALLLLGSGLSAVIALLKRESRDRWRRHWLALALIFAYLSLDEAAAIHEHLIWILGDLPEVGGLLYYPWVVVGFAFVVAFLVAFARFFVHLPRRTRVLFLLAGACYVGGALGLEMVGGLFLHAGGHSPVTHAIQFVEETLEMAGSAIFAYALIDYLATWIGEVQVNIRKS